MSAEAIVILVIYVLAMPMVPAWINFVDSYAADPEPTYKIEKQRMPGGAWLLACALWPVSVAAGLALMISAALAAKSREVKRLEQSK